MKVCIFPYAKTPHSTSRNTSSEAYVYENWIYHWDSFTDSTKYPVTAGSSCVSMQLPSHLKKRCLFADISGGLFTLTHSTLFFMVDTKHTGRWRKSSALHQQVE